MCPSFNLISRITYFVMCGLMALAVFVIASLPWLLPWYVGLGFAYDLDKVNWLYWYMLVLLYLSGIASFLILNALRRIFRTCVREEPFIMENVRSLRSISLFSGIIALLYASKVFLLNTFYTMVIVMVFAMATVFGYVLAELFRHAIQFKEENDLTV